MTGIPHRKPAQVIKGLEDGLECLLELAAMERPMGSRELARNLGLEYTRVNRLLGTLAHMGLAVQTHDRKYLPGPGLHVLAALSLRGSHLLDCALPHMRALGQETGLRVALGMRWRAHVCYLYHGHTRGLMAPGIASHDLYPVEESSIGLVLLAALEDDEVRRLYQKPDSSLLTDADLLQVVEHVREARERGYAVAGNRHSVAVAIGAPPIAGLAVARAPEDGADLPPEDLPHLVQSLSRTAGRIEAALARRY